MSITDTSAFEAMIAAQGYTVVRRKLPPSEGLDDHAHDFDAWGLVTEGEFRITVDGETRRYRPGDEFQVEAGCSHSEASGPEGVSFVVGRRAR